MHWEQIRDKRGGIPQLALESHEIRAALFTTSTRSDQKTIATLNMLLLSYALKCLYSILCGFPLYKCCSVMMYSDIWLDGTILLSQKSVVPSLWYSSHKLSAATVVAAMTWKSGWDGQGDQSYRMVKINLFSPGAKTPFQSDRECHIFSIVHFQTHSVCSATNNKLSIYGNQINRISIQTACSCVLPSSSSPNVIRNINSWFSNLVVQRKKTRMMRLAQLGSSVELHFINSHN